MPGRSGGGLWRCRSPARSGTAFGQVAAALKAQGVPYLYDADMQVRLRGDASGRGAARIYACEAVVVVVVVSADYAAGDWTRLERRAAFSRAVAAAGVCVLPARFDDRELPGLLPDVVAVDPRRYTPAQFADLVVAKLADLAISPAPSGGGWRGVRVEEADPRRLGVNAAISAALIQRAFSPASNTHNIAARSLGRGMPLVEATAREPADAECLSAGRLGAVGAEVPAVDPIDPWQVPRRIGQGEPAAARTRRRPRP